MQRDLRKSAVKKIADQLEQYGKHDLARLNLRLSAVEKTLSAVSADAAHVRERSNVWDSFQHHVGAWADLMTSVDGKIDHLAR